MADDDLAELMWHLKALSESPFKSVQQAYMAHAGDAIDRLLNLLSDLDSLYDEIGDLQVDGSGKCRWSDVANLQHSLLRMRRAVGGASSVSRPQGNTP